MIKKILINTTAIALLVTGCSDKEETKEKAKVVTSTATPKIEIVSNDNAKEIKIQEKQKVEETNKSYYFDYKDKEKVEEEKKPRTKIDANMNVRSPYEKVEVSMLVKSLSKEFIVKCSACHNDYANGIIGPSLLDKDSKFIFETIKKFKTDESANVLMTDLVKKMDDKKIQKLADEIYEFNKQIKELRK